MKPGTPLPWEQFGPFVVDKDEGEIASCSGGADAAYIVHAANLYPELVKLCQWTVTYLEYLERIDPTTDGERYELLNDLRAVLAKAKGE